MKKLIFIVCAYLALIVPWQVFGAEDFSGEKGYVDFGNLTGVYGEPRVQINLGTAMLGFVGAAAKSEEPDVAELFNKLKSVRVLVYDIDGNADDALKTVDKVTKDIQKEGWETIVSVNEDREKVRIYAKMTNDKIDGLVVMAVGDDSHDNNGKPEAVFINIIGQIDPAQVGRITSRFNVDVDVDVKQ